MASICHIKKSKFNESILGYLCTYVHIWGQRQSFDEEHGVLKHLFVWVLASLPIDLHYLLESSRDESAVRGHFHIHRLGRSVHEESDWAIFAWIFDCELSIKVALELLECQFLGWLDVNEVRPDVDSRLESEFIWFRTLLFWVFTFWIRISFSILIMVLSVNFGNLTNKLLANWLDVICHIF